MAQIVRMLQPVLKLAFYGIALFLSAGFVALFLPPKKYPWVLDIWHYTKPISDTVARYLDTNFRGYDLSLLAALAGVFGIYLALERTLWAVEDTLRQRAFQAKKLKATATAAAQPAPQPAPRVAAMPSARNPVYSSEAIVVIDLVNSTSIVTRFGNTFLLMLKHRLEHQVNEISLRNSAGFSKGTGDGFLLCFPSLANSVIALREIFEALPVMNADLPDGAEIALRGALNFGEVIADRDGDRTGGAIHKTFRLQGLPAASLIESEGGIKREEFPEKNYTLVSEEAISGLTKIQGLQSRFLGLCELKGFPGLHRVYQI